MLKEILSGLRRLVYPPNCLICQNSLPTPESPLLLCSPCQETLEDNRPPFCLRCSRWLGEDWTRPLCPECRRKNPQFDFAWCACLYNEPLKTLIHRFKYGQKTLLRHVFLERMQRFVQNYRFDIEQFDLVMPIPLSPTRMRERGYNQAQLLAEGLARQFALALSLHHLVRIRHTKNQALLSQKERWTNIRGAFKIKHSEAVKNKSVLLVDDLLTTGATASEAAGVLKEAGAKTVGVFTLAVTV